MNTKRVVVTGTGVICPLGLNVAVKINDVKQVVEVDLIDVLKAEFARVMKELK